MLEEIDPAGITSDESSVERRTWRNWFLLLGTAVVTTIGLSTAIMPFLRARFERLWPWEHTEVVLLCGLSLAVFSFVVYLTEQQRQVAALRRQLLRMRGLEEVNELKTDLLNLLRHQTRTPLTGIMSAAELLSEEDNIESRQRARWARMVLDNARRLHGLLENGTLLCRYRTGRIDLSMGPVELNALVSEILTDLDEKLRSKSLEVELRSSKAVWIHANRQHMKLVVRALLENAVRFSPVAAKIGLQIAKGDESATLAVVDHGKGIDPELLPHIFDGFVVEDLPHHHSGNGLSLALSRAIVQSHGGDINVHSVPNSETRFVVMLPVAGESPLLSTAAPGSRAGST
ncbi:MAG: sensor histidine kinase [Candidatus Krumholzibacteriia bacterium]